MSYMEQNKKRKQTLESVQYGLEIILKVFLKIQNFAQVNKTGQLKLPHKIQTNVFILLFADKVCKYLM